MLTGDHPLTAVNIAYSCGLIDKNFKENIITTLECKEIIAQLNQVIEDSKTEELYLVITGDSFGILQKNLSPSLKKKVSNCSFILKQIVL